MKRTQYILFAAWLSIFSSQIILSADRSDLKLPKDALWQKLLKEQLKHEKNCDLSEILTYNEMMVGQEIAISGKIICIGGQQYEYSRLRQHLKFEFRLCEPNVC